MPDKPDITPPQGIDAQAAQRAVAAALKGKPRLDDLYSLPMIAYVKRYLMRVIELGEDFLESGTGPVSVRDVINASHSMLAILKHEDRIREFMALRAEQARKQPALKAVPLRNDSRSATTATAARPWTFKIVGSDN